MSRDITSVNVVVVVVVVDRLVVIVVVVVVVIVVVVDRLVVKSERRFSKKIRAGLKKLERKRRRSITVFTN